MLSFRNSNTICSLMHMKTEYVFLKGFHSKVTNWIMQCVSSVTYSFLINGSPRGRVRPSRGIRQGDPLSPYLFILCSEVLSGLCNRAQEDGSLKGIISISIFFEVTTKYLEN